MLLVFNVKKIISILFFNNYCLKMYKDVFIKFKKVKYFEKF